ncbi:O-methyltransferase-domain-containing protein [Elsinoe ampelina]|uniref:O-methyltransferase-domain-containing protein n=1 Tax=Elsinoe ampelina TaxID=302913 RepID=A0A6A6GAX7_9PEZI|nr:O-methyltransferase-domain-containing protein [Elsinoe ampelina]
MSTLKDYSDNIASSVQVVEKYLAEKNLPQPSYDVTSPKEFPADAPPEVQQARIKIIEQARELYQLAQYPNESAVTFLEYGMMEAGCLRALHELGVFAAIPQEPGSSISLTELAKATKLENLIGPLDRMVGRLRVSGILREPTPGHVAHTSISINYAAGQPFNSEIGWFTSIGLKSMALMSDQMQAFRDTVPLRSNSAFNLAFNTPLHFMEWMTHHPIREKQFCDVMDSFFRTPPFSMRHIVAAYPWSTLGPSHLVDVGGNAGLVSIELAKAAPQMRFTVQDQPGPVALGESTLPAEFADRITFQTHDFFTPNPQSAPDFFLLRHILHDWPDAEAGKIVKHIAARMGPHTKLLIYDSVHQKLSREYYQAAPISNLDIVMLGVFNGLERTVEQWGRLFRGVDERLRVEETISPPGSAASLLVVGLGEGRRDSPKEA